MHKTYQTKLCKKSMYPIGNLLEAYLDDWSRYFQHIERNLFVDMVYRKIPIAILKKQYLSTYNITARQFNSIKAQLQGRISSVKELKKSELGIKILKLKELENKLLLFLNDKKKYKYSIDNIKINDKNFPRFIKKYKYIKIKIHHTKRKIQELTIKVSKLKSDMESDIVRICFGSKELFKKQY